MRESPLATDFLALRSEVSLEETLEKLGYQDLGGLARALREVGHTVDQIATWLEKSPSVISCLTKDISQRRLAKQKIQEAKIQKEIRKLRRETGRHIRDLAHQFGVSLKKVRRWTAKVNRELRNSTIKIIRQMVRDNPDLSIREVMARLNRSGFSEDFIRQHTQDLRRQTDQPHYVDSKTSQEYLIIHELAKCFDYTDAGMERTLARLKIEPILVLYQGNLRKFFPIKKLLERPSYRRRYQYIRLSQIEPDQNLLRKRPANLDQRDWIVLLAILCYKNAHDIWPPASVIYSSVSRSYPYTLNSIESAIQILIRTNYLIPRHSVRKLTERIAGTYHRSFWASRQCPQELIIEKTTDPTTGTVVYLWRNYVRLENKESRILRDLPRQKTWTERMKEVTTVENAIS